MSQKTAAIAQPVKFSKLCSACGLRNFADSDRCRRCKSDLSRGSAGAGEVKQIRVDTGEPGSLKARRVLTLAVPVILFLLIFFYVRQGSQETQASPGEVEVSQTVPAPPPQPEENSAPENAQSQAAAAKEVLTGLKRFQEATQNKMSYEEYDQMLTQLKADLNNMLPTFVQHSPSDESFRQEIAGALRDYTAAGNWWKTTIRNSSVLNDADRTARLQVEWGSAQTHLGNAEKALPH
jgi:ribosomal protein L40E